MKPWRPRIHDKSPAISREGKFFALNCRTHQEADAIEKSLIRTFVKVRK